MWYAPEEDEQDEIDFHSASFGNIQPCFGHFTQLKSLSLLNLWGDMAPWPACIAELLVRNRHLEQLSLSISEDAIARAEYDPDLDPDERPTFLLFEDICHIYRQTSELSPLALRTLRLGDGIHFPDAERLRGVVDVAVLEDIFIYNGSVLPSPHPPSLLLKRRETWVSVLFTCAQFFFVFGYYLFWARAHVG